MYMRARTSFNSVFVSCFFLLWIIGCGGSGSGGGDDDPADLTPDPFTFSPVETTQLDTWIESNTVTITGTDQAVAVTVSNGEYSVDGGEFTSQQTNIAANQTLTVRVRSASIAGITARMTVTVGGVSGQSASFQATTELDPQAISRVANASCLAPATVGNVNATISLEPAFPDLPALSGLLGIYQKPGDTSRWYAILQDGRAFWFDNNANASSLNEYFDFSGQIRSGGEEGLLGLAFDPQFASNGYFYISYTNNSGDSVIARFMDDGNFLLSSSSEVEVLTLDQPAGNHNGGHIAFGPDGYLYIGFGDGGGANDTYGHGQNTQSLHSNILRIDVSNLPYSVPSDNPFVNDNEILDEIYAYGLRNPWRWSFDQQTGELWLGDVGQNQWEEINLVDSGDNLGWPIMEASSCFQSANCDQTGLTLPVAEYNHNNGDCSVTGGYVYRGSNYPQMQGQYFYGDYCTGRIFSATPTGNQTFNAREELLTGMNISSFAQDANGEVFVLQYFGDTGEGVYRIVGQGGTGSNIAQNLSETGCFESTASKTYPAAVVPYDVTSQLWSDGALKTRLFALPDNEVVEVNDEGDFGFPQGSVLIKNFIYNNEFLETRLMMHHASGWAGYSYRWLPDQSDAVLVDGDSQEIVTSGNFNHIIPTRGQCFECHTNAADVSLGIETSQLNKTITYPNGNSANQIGALVGAGLVGSIYTSDLLEPMAAIDDANASDELKARSYLHSNCSGCHRPGGPASQIDLRIFTPLADTGACDVMPQNGNLGLTDPRIILPGDASRSVLVQRMQSQDSNERMPPVASQVVDSEAVALVTAWVNQMSGCTD